MLLNHRVIYSDNGFITDISNDMSDINVGTKVIPMVVGEDYIYVGSEMPFNHRYISVTVANDVTAVASVELWDGDSWEAALDVQDFTSVSGKSLAQSGIIMWSLDPNKQWLSDDTNYNSQTITGLSDARIMGLYWARISFSATLKNTTAIKYIGHKFATDDDLKLRYPDLIRSNVYTQFLAGKTNWEEQHIICAENIITDLKKKNVVKSANQIIDWRLFTEASVYKLAELIFTAFGRDYDVSRENAANKYKQALSMGQYNLDTNMDTRLNPIESQTTQGFLKR